MIQVACKKWATYTRTWFFTIMHPIICTKTKLCPKSLYQKQEISPKKIKDVLDQSCAFVNLAALPLC